MLVTSGTGVVFGPLDTVRVTVEPLPTDWPAAGLWSMTVFAGWSLSTNVGTGRKPIACSSELAWPIGSLITDGTETGCGPFEVLIRTAWPTGTFTPAFGSCASTVPAGWSEGTWCTSAFRPTRVSAATASVEL